MSQLSDLLAALQAKRGNAYVSEFNAYMGAVNERLDDVAQLLTDKLIGTSVTTLTLGAVTQTMIVETGLGFATGRRATIANDATHLMVGTVASYDKNTGELVVAVGKASDVTGAGTFDSWTVTSTGDEGDKGDPGEAFWDAVRSVDHTTDDDSSGNVVAGAKSFLKCDVTGGAIAIAVQVATDRLALVPEGTLSDANYIRITPPAGKEIFGQGADNAVVIRRPIRGLAIFKDENGNYW